MDFKRLLFLFLALLLLIVITSCTRSYKPSEPIEVTQSLEESVESELEPPTGATEVMGQIFMLATQTAMAEQGILREAPTVEPTKVVVENEQAAPQQPEAQEPVPPSEPQQPPSQEAVPAPVPENPGTYVLREGEFPYCIARRYNVNPNELIRESGIAPNQTVSAGTTLVFPKSDRTFPGKRRLENHPTDYSVREGETIFSIACVFGDVDPQSIITANNLQEPYTLTAGQVLHIP